MKKKLVPSVAVKLPGWRWIVYTGFGAAVFVFFYKASHGPMTLSLTVLQDNGSTRDAGFFGLLFGAGAFALCPLFIDTFVRGFTASRNKTAFMEDAAVEVLKDGAVLAVEVVIDAAIGGATSRGGGGGSSSGGGGGGRSGGGGASGNY